jgi:hypothetical protein
MCPKIRCDEKSEKFCKIFWELNRTLLADVLGAAIDDGLRRLLHVCVPAMRSRDLQCQICPSQYRYRHKCTGMHRSTHLGLRHIASSPAAPFLTLEKAVIF